MHKYKVYSDVWTAYYLEAKNDLHAVYLATKKCLEEGVNVEVIFNIDDGDSKSCQKLIYDCCDYVVQLKEKWGGSLEVNK